MISTWGQPSSWWAMDAALATLSMLRLHTSLDPDRLTLL